MYLYVGSVFRRRMTSFVMTRATGARLAEGATTGTAHVRTTIFPTHVTSPKQFSLPATVRSLGPFSTIVEGRIFLVSSYAKGQRQRHVQCLARVLALHVLLVCAYCAPACAYLAFVCAFASLFVLADTQCLRARVVLARVPFARVP